MDLELGPNMGAPPLLFGMEREQVRRTLSDFNCETRSSEPENDFYPNEGIILGYDEKDELEFIEIIPPSQARFDGIDYFSISLSSCIQEMSDRGLNAEFEDGGYNFEPVGIALYSPKEVLESVSIYRAGYYDDL